MSMWTASLLAYKNGIFKMAQILKAALFTWASSTSTAGV